MSSHVKSFSEYDSLRCVLLLDSAVHVVLERNDDNERKKPWASYNILFITFTAYIIMSLRITAGFTQARFLPVINSLQQYVCKTHCSFHRKTIYGTILSHRRAYVVGGSTYIVHKNNLQRKSKPSIIPRHEKLYMYICSRPINDFARFEIEQRRCKECNSERIINKSQSNLAIGGIAPLPVGTGAPV